MAPSSTHCTISALDPPRLPALDESQRDWARGLGVAETAGPPT
jgi:hypothetical protein